MWNCSENTALADDLQKAQAFRILKDESADISEK